MNNLNKKEVEFLFVATDIQRCQSSDDGRIKGILLVKLANELDRPEKDIDDDGDKQSDNSN